MYELTILGPWNYHRTRYYVHNVIQVRSNIPHHTCFPRRKCSRWFQEFPSSQWATPLTRTLSESLMRSFSKRSHTSKLYSIQGDPCWMYTNQDPRTVHQTTCTRTDANASDDCKSLPIHKERPLDTNVTTIFSLEVLLAEHLLGARSRARLPNGEFVLRLGVVLCGHKNMNTHRLPRDVHLPRVPSSNGLSVCVVIPDTSSCAFVGVVTMCLQVTRPHDHVNNSKLSWNCIDHEYVGPQWQL